MTPIASMISSVASGEVRVGVHGPPESASIHPRCRQQRLGGPTSVSGDECRGPRVGSRGAGTFHVFAASVKHEAARRALVARLTFAAALLLVGLLVTACGSSEHVSTSAQWAGTASDHAAPRSAVVTCAGAGRMGPPVLPESVAWSGSDRGAAGYVVTPRTPVEATLTADPECKGAQAFRFYVLRTEFADSADRCGHETVAAPALVWDWQLAHPARSNVYQLGAPLTLTWPKTDGAGKQAPLGDYELCLILNDAKGGTQAFHASVVLSSG
jgi:hypothetical protein